MFELNSFGISLFTTSFTVSDLQCTRFIYVRRVSAAISQSSVGSAPKHVFRAMEMRKNEILNSQGSVDLKNEHCQSTPM